MRERILLLLTLALFLLLPHPLVSQNARPLSPDHWSYDLTEALHALGLQGATLPLFRGGSYAAQMVELAGSDERVTQDDEVLKRFLNLWSGRLGEEGGREDASLYGEVTLGRADDPSLPISGEESYLRILAAQGFSWGGSLWAEPVLTDGEVGSSFRSVGVSIPVGTFDLFLGRVPMALGQGRDPFLLTGRKALDGVFLNSRAPFELPGFLQALGPTRLHLGFSPLISTPSASSAWWGSFGMGFSPHPRVDFGALRTVRFAGEGLEGWSFNNALGLLTTASENNAFDDSQGELSLRVRWSLLGQPLSSYLSMGFEDKATVYEDPAVLVGILAPFLRPEALYTFRYEFQAMGRRAMWCGGCDREVHAWYDHPAFSHYTLDGIPLGATLGGYGASHRGRLEGWFSARPIRAFGEYQRISRGQSNLLLIMHAAPIRAEVWTVGMEWFLGNPGLAGARWMASGAVRSMTLDEESDFALSASLTIIPGK